VARSKKSRALGKDLSQILGRSKLPKERGGQKAGDEKRLENVEPPASETSASDQPGEAKLQEAIVRRAHQSSPVLKGRPLATHLRAFLWGVAIALIFGIGYIFWPRPVLQSPTPVSISMSLPQLTPTTELTTPIPPASTPQPSDAIFVPLPSASLPAGVTHTLIPAAEAVGWATSLDDRGHFGMPNIQAGYLQGHIYHGALQFDLSAVASGSTITYAALEVVGLDEQNLSPGGTWQLRLLDPAIDAVWPTLTYGTLHEARVEATILPALTSADLAQNNVNVFLFDSESLSALQRHLTNGAVSFRLDGPTAGQDNLFTWDSGYRSEQVLETRPILRLIVVPPPTPENVIVTSTPTPENIITLAAMAATATEIVKTVGTYTPVPENWMTPAVVTPQPTPANTATAAFQEAVVTAAAFLYGSATPTPPNVWTATPTSSYTLVNGTPIPSEFVVGGGTPALNGFIPPGESAPYYVIVTSTPTPENIITVAAMAVMATQVADTVGTYTPVPDNWVTPAVVTPQPTPANTATAVYQRAEATAAVLLFGLATPVSVWTATPTPVFVPLDGEIATPWATFTPTATPQTAPSALVGKIAFLSNRSGGPQPLVYVIDPDGSNLAVLTDRVVYDAAVARDRYSADQRFRVFVKDALRFDGKYVPALYLYDYFYNVEDQLTHFGAGQAWDPVWSPAREQIAFVSNDSSDDEIWIVNRDGTNLQQLTRSNVEFNAREAGKDTFLPEVNGHPSWSPDGSQIVFWSNRTGNRQIWIMNADGSNPYSLSTTSYDDWNPVWIKYTDPARDPVPNLAK
jgi:hypothetical protein